MYSPSPQVSFFRNSIYRIYLEENFIFSLKYFNLSVYVSVCMCLVVYFFYTTLAEVREGHHIPWNWNVSKFPTWVLGKKLKSCEKPLNALNFWSISSIYCVILSAHLLPLTNVYIEYVKIVMDGINFSKATSWHSNSQP